jgi:hypothetical protein
MSAHRTKLLSGTVIGISISDAEDLLIRGFGREHLREILIALCRPLLRHAADLAYGGHFQKDSFTRDLIQLISAEQEEGTLDQRPWIGKLYNHSPWPFYLDITSADEAAWIDCCKFIRITQEMAGFETDKREVLPRSEDSVSSMRIVFNKAVVLTSMRRLMVDGVDVTESGGTLKNIRVSARVLLGGATSKFSGIMPGLFEEALFALERRDRSPLFILGGFGGASGLLAEYLRRGARPKDFRVESYREKVSAYRTLEEAFGKLRVPQNARQPAEAIETLCALIENGRGDLGTLLQNGLSHVDNLRLLETTDAAEAVTLVLQGLSNAPNLR